MAEPMQNPTGLDALGKRVPDPAAESPDMALDELTRLASQVCGTPMAFVSFLDEQRQWFKSRIGLELTEAPRENSFCSQTISQKGVFVVEDAAKDARFARHPLVTSPCKVRFYAGVSLQVPEAGNSWTLSVLDRAPRRLDPGHAQLLQLLGRQISTQIELRRKSIDLARAVEDLNKTANRLRDSEAF